MTDKLIKFTSWNVNGMELQDTGLSKAKTFRCNNAPGDSPAREGCI